MVLLEPSADRQLRGWREYAADLLRHYASLVITFTVTYLALSGGSLFGAGTGDELLGIVRVLLLLAIVSLVGHGFVTWLRKRVSVFFSGIFTWIAYVASMSLLMLGAERGAFIANLAFSMLVAVPIVAMQMVLRAFVPVFQVRIRGERVRLVMSSPEH